MRKILAVILTLFMISTLSADESTMLKVDGLSEAKFGEYTLSADDWYVDYEGAADNLMARQETELAVDDGYLFTLFYTGTRDQTTIKLVPSFNTKFAAPDMSFGNISNVGDIKSIKMKLFNFGYDITIYLNFERSNGEKFRCKMGTLDSHKTGPVELLFENYSYINDPKYKKFESGPVYPNSANNLYLDSIEIHSNKKSPYDGYNVIGIGDIDIIYDKAKLITGEEMDFDSLFGIDSNFMAKEKEIELQNLTNRKNKEKYNEQLMDKPKEEIISEK